MIKKTALDEAALHKIAATGFIGIDAAGGTYLETSEEVSPWRFGRLKTLGLIRSGNDALLEGIEAQTWWPKEQENGLATD